MTERDWKKLLNELIQGIDKNTTSGADISKFLRTKPNNTTYSGEEIARFVEEVDEIVSYPLVNAELFATALQSKDREVLRLWVKEVQDI